MIRINLLPVKVDRRKETARTQMFIGILVLVLEAVLLAILYINMQAKYDEAKNANSVVAARVKRIEKENAEHSKILAEIKEFEKRRDAINELLLARTGPVNVMMEISRFLSKEGRPYFDYDDYQQKIQENPALGFDEKWDHRNIWISSFKEADKLVTINGIGITHEDVAEFLKRIGLSKFFSSHQLKKTNLVQPNIKMPGFDPKLAIPVVSFEIQSKIKYQ